MISLSFAKLLFTSDCKNIRKSSYWQARQLQAPLWSSAEFCACTQY